MRCNNHSRSRVCLRVLNPTACHPALRAPRCVQLDEAVAELRKSQDRMRTAEALLKSMVGEVEQVRLAGWLVGCGMCGNKLGHQRGVCFCPWSVKYKNA